MMTLELSQPSRGNNSALICFNLILSVIRYFITAEWLGNINFWGWDSISQSAWEYYPIVPLILECLGMINDLDSGFQFVCRLFARFHNLEAEAAWPLIGPASATTAASNRGRACSLSHFTLLQSPCHKLSWIPKHKNFDNINLVKRTSECETGNCPYRIVCLLLCPL